MTLFDLAKKNIQGNFRNYSIYFVSMFFNVAIFYIFASLQYHEDVHEAISSSQNMRSVFMAATFILILFASIFMYAMNQFFTRKRKKEVGLYALLGLSKKTIGRMLFYENLLIGIAVLAAGIAAGSFLSKLFTMALMRLLEIDVDVGMTLSVPALLSTVIVFMAIIFMTSFQAYRLIYRYQLIELFRAEQKGEEEPRASKLAAVAAVLCLAVSYWFGFRPFLNNAEIALNFSVMASGMIAGTFLLFSSLLIWLLTYVRQNKRFYYKGMNLIIASHLLHRLKGNARTLSIITLLSAVVLCAFSFGFSAYYAYEKTARMIAPFSYMYIAQDEAFNEKVDAIIESDFSHPVIERIELPIVHLKGEASSEQILSKRDKAAEPDPLKVIAASEYNRAAAVLKLEQLQLKEDGHAIAVRPMYTDYSEDDYIGEKITLELPEGQISLTFAGMTAGRIINWHYPDIMIVVSDNVFQQISEQRPPHHYVGYIAANQKTAKETADALAVIATEESKLSSFYTEYRLGIEDAAFNVFILGFLGMIFLMATGSILYFKQLTEAVSSMSGYDILQKIGVSKREIRSVIVKQNALIFLLPLVIGLCHYIVLFQWLKKLFGGLGGISLALPILICVFVFIVIYMIYYAMTVNSIHKLVFGETARMLHLTAAAAVLIGVVIMIGLLSWVEPAANNEERSGGEMIRLEFPEPTGPYVAGVTELHLVDGSRRDPWVKDEQRELMISIWYPASESSGQPAPYMRPGAAEYYDEHVIPTIGLDAGRIDLAGIVTHAWLHAPVARTEEGWPVIFYSPGGSIPRNFGTFHALELASRGYIVVAVDHTHEAAVVEFPDGRVLTDALPTLNAETLLKMMDVRVDDVRFVLNQLFEMKNGNFPDHADQALLESLSEAIDLEKIGIFGHSAGGATAAQAMHEDARIDAGIDMDGSMGYLPDHLLPVALEGLDRPFMLMNSGYNDEGEVDSHLTALDRNFFWNQSTGWKMDVSMPNGAHFTFTDYQLLLPQLSKKQSLSRQVMHHSIGTVDADHALAAQRDYITAFFDHHLKGIPQPLLESPESPYDEVIIVE